MDLSLLPRGILIGLTVAAPVGPMAVLCIRRTLARGRASGVVSGLGIAVGDGLFSAVAAFGLSSISNFLVGHQDWIRLLGGLFLLAIGINMLRSRAAARAASSDSEARGGNFGIFLSTLALTLTNPPTIVLFAAIFASLGGIDDRASAVMLVLGVVAGSMLWWLLLTRSVGVLRGRLTPRRLTWINRVSGAMIFVFGLAGLVSVVR